MKKLILSLAALIASLSAARAQLTLSNWSITTDTLSFDISGTATATQLPATNLGMLWLAAPGNNTWVNNLDNPSPVVATGTIDGFDVSSSGDRFVLSLSAAGASVGFLIGFEDMGPSDRVEFDFTDGLNDEINLHVELTSVGKYNPGDISPEDLVLYWGGNPYIGDTASAVALNLDVAAIPEPSTYAAILGGMAGVAALIVRRRKQA
jgi:PEP-CTERM putative exosortase interaction domain